MSAMSDMSRAIRTTIELHSTGPTLNDCPLSALREFAEIITAYLADIREAIVRREDSEWRGVYPGFCVNPETCRGKTHCPRDYSCVE